uniref:Uncharacterized protein n=1 Tax=Anguilla anguilla TaxID=7936 RepID=A0A0E9QN12_ANGAN
MDHIKYLAKASNMSVCGLNQLFIYF